MTRTSPTSGAVRLELVGLVTGRERGGDARARSSNGEAPSTRPDVVLIDIEMPRIDGITATARILELWPETRVLVFTAHREPNLASLAAECGAAGYLDKSASAEELREAIATVTAGGDWFPGQARRDTGDGELARLRRLSPRERQILDLLASGMRAEGVAAEIGISPATVYTHVRNIVGKLEVDTRTQAVAIATRYAFLAPGS